MNFKTLCLCGFVSALVFPCSVWAEVLTVDETTVPIRVDGHLSKWPAARMILLGQPSQVVSGKSFWKSAEDFNGRVFITYDSQFLYISAIVQKKGAVVNSNEKLSLWNGDCLEIYLSTHFRAQDLKRVSGSEYRIGFSPGTGCGNPRIFCFNKNKEITGARVISRATKTGYILEACVPFSFFGGLDIGPGKNSAFNVVLNEGGPVSGNRILQLDYLGIPMSWNKPVSWATLQWVGKDEISIPDVKTEDLYAYLVQDGTKGSTFLGLKSFQGNVIDPKGKPLSGVKISTWPKTKEVVTDSKGQFKIEKIKLYDKSVLYGRLDGYMSSLFPRPSKVGPVTLTLNPIPKGIDVTGTDPSPYFYGKSLRLSPQGTFEPVTLTQNGNDKGIRLNVLRLCGMENAQGPLENELQVLDKFLANARGIGAEPIIELPIRRQDPGSVSDWVRYCNVTKKYGVRFWTVGDEPDIREPKGEEATYSAYDYINDFRVIYNAIKTTDPSVVVLGPELAWKYEEGENDWLTPFLQYNGDIVNVVSIHRYAAVTPDQNTSKVLLASLRSESALFSNLRDEISSLMDVFIPLLVTGANGNLKASISPTGKVVDEAGPKSFWSALWTVDQLGIALNEKLGMDMYSPYKTGSPLASAADAGPTPSDWAFKLFGLILKGSVVPAQIQQPGISVYASQESKTKNVSLLIVNKGDRYSHPKTMLNGKDCDLTVEAGLDMRVDYEIPSFSISVLKINADNSPGEVVRYSSKLAESGQAPETLVLKPW